MTADQLLAKSRRLVLGAWVDVWLAMKAKAGR